MAVISAGVIHGGLAFQEDYFALDIGQDGPVVMPMHEAVMEDLIIGTGVEANPLMATCLQSIIFSKSNHQHFSPI